jgi:hypothetical protein
MTRKKAIDPKRLALLDRQDKLRTQFEKDFARLTRTFHRLEKCRRALARLARQLAKMDADANGSARDPARTEKRQAVG